MRIIPVLDLKGGVVVRATGGRRDQYRPIVTPLSEGADIDAVALGMRKLHPFDVFYVADLDAIEGGAIDVKALAKLQRLESRPEVWLDAGFRHSEGLEAVLDRPGLCPVLGTESQDDEVLLKRYRHHPDLILSLDFFADGYRGPASIPERPDTWPSRIIVMTLEKVGSGAGPDIQRVKDVIDRAGGREVIAAGGVRDATDLRALAEIGAAAALLATSLHDGTLRPHEIAALNG